MMEITDPKLAEEVNAWRTEHKPDPTIKRRMVVDSEWQTDYRDQKNPRMVGHAAVFNRRTELFPDFVEEIAPTAFNNAIQDQDIYALWNHNSSDVLGNTGAKTLFLSVDDVGLHYEIIPPDTTLGRDLLTLMRRGDIRKSSFGFSILDDEITHEGRKTIRTIKSVKLFDVSPVTYPAYKETDVHVRMMTSRSETVYVCEDSGQVIVQERTAEIVPPKPALSDEDLFRVFDGLKDRAFKT